jgi:DNA-binding transcriptional regulator YiaG
VSVPGQQRQEKFNDILDSNPTRAELESMGTELLAAARKLDPAPDSVGRPPHGKRTNGPLIKHLRKQTGLSRDEFAAQHYIGVSTVQRAENGHQLDEDSIKRLAEALDVTPSALILKDG